MRGKSRGPMLSLFAVPFLLYLSFYLAFQTRNTPHLPTLNASFKPIVTLQDILNNSNALLLPASTDTNTDTPPSFPALFFFLHIPKTAGTTFQAYLKQTLCNNNPKSAIFKWCPLQGGLTWPDTEINNIIDPVTNLLTCSVAEKETGIQRLRHLQFTLHQPVLGLTMLRDPYFSVISALGHDLWRGRIVSPSDKLHAYMNQTCSGWGEERWSQDQGVECGWPYQGYNIRNRLMKSLIGGEADVDDSKELEMATVEDAVKVLDDELFFVGIVEHFELSLCLLEYQLGMFDPEKCSSSCDESSLVKKDPTAGDTTAANSDESIQATNTAEQHALDVDKMTFTVQDLKAIQDLTRLDAIIYAHGLDMFFKRIKVIEKEYGITMFCHKAKRE